MEDAPAAEDRILTIPNVISLVRLLCVPVFLWLLFPQENRLGAATLLAVLLSRYRAPARSLTVTGPPSTTDLRA